MALVVRSQPTLPSASRAVWTLREPEMGQIPGVTKPARPARLQSTMLEGDENRGRSYVVRVTDPPILHERLPRSPRLRVRVPLCLFIYLHISARRSTLGCGVSDPVRRHTALFRRNKPRT